MPKVVRTVASFGTDFELRINATIITGHRRIPRQDPECALEELVEVAVRVLSLKAYHWPGNVRELEGVLRQNG